MALKDFLEEATIMKEMKHPNLVQLLGTYYKHFNFPLVMRIKLFYLDYCRLKHLSL